MAVATGVHGQPELTAAGAATVLPDLTDSIGLLNLLEDLTCR
ncbi:hypothetical protein [Streptomyces sp. TRM68367]